MAWYVPTREPVTCVPLSTFDRHSLPRTWSFLESAFFFRFVSNQRLCARHSNPNTSQTAKDVRAAQEALVGIFERIESFLRRLEIYTTVPPNEEMVDTITTIMTEILGILSIATKEIKQGRISKSLFYECNISPFDGICCRKFSKKVDRKNRDRGCVEEARQADARGGSNGHRANFEARAYC